MAGGVTAAEEEALAASFLLGEPSPPPSSDEGAGGAAGEDCALAAAEPAPGNSEHAAAQLATAEAALAPAPPSLAQVPAAEAETSPPLTPMASALRQRISELDRPASQRGPAVSRRRRGSAAPAGQAPAAPLAPAPAEEPSGGGTSGTGSGAALERAASVRLRVVRSDDLAALERRCAFGCSGRLVIAECWPRGQGCTAVEDSWYMWSTALSHPPRCRSFPWRRALQKECELAATRRRLSSTQVGGSRLGMHSHAYCISRDARPAMHLHSLLVLPPCHDAC